MFYFKNQVSFRISKALSSLSNSILWIYLQHHADPRNDLYICVAYAVHSGGSTAKKSSFWKELDGSTSKFQLKPGHRILVGDFNARLGSITGDHAKNSNKQYLLNFIQDHSLVNLNSIRAYGQYTFHNINNGDRSIIDYLLSDMDESQIPEHIILKGSLGTSAQTAHKAILSKIAIAVKETKTDTLRVSPKWRSITEKNIAWFQKSLYDELRKLSVVESGYKLVLAALNRAKTTSLGRIRPRPKSAKHATPELDHLHADLGAALEKYRVQPNQYNLNKCISSEKQSSRS